MGNKWGPGCCDCGNPCGCPYPASFSVSGSCCGQSWGTISPSTGGYVGCSQSAFIWTNPSTNYCVDYCELVTFGTYAFLRRIGWVSTVGATAWTFRLQMEFDIYTLPGGVCTKNTLGKTWYMNYTRNCADGTGAMTFTGNTGSGGDGLYTPSCTPPTVTVTA